VKLFPDQQPERPLADVILAGINVMADRPLLPQPAKKPKKTKKAK
jgi:hypothetical protein